MKKMKKTLSLILALVMLLSLGTSAFAGEVEAEQPVVEEQVVEPVQEPVVEEPAAEEPAAEEPAAEEPVAEVPAAEEPVVTNTVVRQPEDLSICVGEEAVFSVAVLGSATFQWQCSKDGGRTWKNLKVATYGNGPEMRLTAALRHNGYRFRAVVTFANGEVLTTSAAVMKVVSVKITEQPQDVTVAPGENAVFTVKASGSVKSYRWQQSKDGGKTWVYLTLKNYPAKSTLTMVGKEEFNGRLLRAVITGADNSKVISDAVMLTVAEPVPEVPVAPVSPEMPARTLQVAPKRGPVSEVGVVVDAPAGALPAEAELNVAPVDVAECEELTKALLGDDIEIGYAVDISFSTPADGEIEPVQGNPVIVYLTVPGLSEHEGFQIVHISDSGNATRMTPVPESELPRPLGENEIAIKSDEFSTYVLTWTADEVEQSATIHWGTWSDGEFQELQTPTSIDSSAASVDIEVIIDASKYYYVGAEYKLTEDAEEYENLTSTVLKKVEGGWQIKLEDSGTTLVAPGSHIFVHYAEYGEGQTYVPPSPPPADVLAPDTEKQVTDNGDGTFTIRLDIEGKSDHSTSQVGANVIVVMDITQSMTEGMPGGGTRMDAAKQAVRTLVNTLDPDTNLINFAAVNFGNNAQPYSVTLGGGTWTQSKTTMLGYANGLPDNPNDYGTCWQAGLRGGYDLASAAHSDATLSGNQTYVIFVTDGNPNCYARNNDGSGRWYGSTGPGYNANAYAAATYWSNRIPSVANFYGVFCGDADGADHLEDLVVAANGNNTNFINGTSASAIEAAFQNIATTIVNNLGAGGVTVDDGIPTLSNVSANVSGVVDEGSGDHGFTYYIKPLNGEETVWEDAPGASYSQANGVTWDLGEAGELQNGWIYSVEFKVWPSQAAYDLIADLNNGIRTFDSLSAEEQAAVDGNKTDGYTLKTNTHLYTTFTDLDGNTYQEVNDARPEAMPLPAPTISVEKLWHNYLDSRADADIDGLQMVLSRDGEDYFEFDVGPNDDPAKAWKYDDIYISVGQIVDGKIVETGHDYYVTEKGKETIDKTEYWEVNSPYYHPMIVDGELVIYVQDDDASTAAFELNGHKYVEADSTQQYLVAVNERVSWLNLYKEVTGDGAPADTLFKYNVTITEPAAADGSTPNVFFSVFGDDVSYMPGVETTATEWLDESYNPARTYYYFPSGSTIELNMKAGWSVRFLNVATDSTYEITEVEADMAPGFVFTSAKSVETFYDGPNKKVADGFPKTTNFDTSTVTGTINQTNTDYAVTFSNEYVGVFYVYHSSNCDVELIPMATAGVAYSASNPFDIFAKTYEGTLYGGYYSDYAGKSEDFDAATLTYTDGLGSDANGTPYSLAYIKESGKAAWSSSAAYSVVGTAITPVKDAVYFLKEVPTAYLQPYTYFTYYKAAPQNIAALWTISALDDLNYTGAGFYIQNVQTGTTNVVSSLSIKAANSTTTVKLTASKCFGLKQGVLDGYLSYVKINDMIGSKINIWQYWTTPDGIEVCGIVQRELDTTSGTKAGVGYNDTAYPGT